MVGAVVPEVLHILVRLPFLERDEDRAVGEDHPDGAAVGLLLTHSRL